ncbi:MAG TPA: TMEM165/GDT1 family protein [Planctomycetota bacterium]|nr:TMEM165/GDT1 family protein [Planctomycetota bacterium]
MDWKLAAWTFGIVFLAELGDKTQLAVFALTGKTGRPLSVLAGAAAALVVVTFLGVVLGGAIKKFLPERIMDFASAVLFLAVGAFLLARCFLASPDPGS